MLCSLGCGETTDSEDTDIDAQNTCLQSPPTCQVGFGISEFAPADGVEEVTIIQNGQGHWLVPIAFRQSGLSDVVEARVLVDVGGSIVSDISETVGMAEVSGDECTYEFWGLEAWLDTGSLVDDCEGAPYYDHKVANIEVQLVDLDGRSVSCAASTTLLYEGEETGKLASQTGCPTTSRLEMSRSAAWPTIFAGDHGSKGGEFFGPMHGQEVMEIPGSRPALTLVGDSYVYIQPQNDPHLYVYDRAAMESGPLTSFEGEEPTLASLRHVASRGVSRPAP